MATIRKSATLEAADLMRLVQALRAIQVCTGAYPWPLLDLTMGQLKAVMLLVPHRPRPQPRARRQPRHCAVSRDAARRSPGQAEAGQARRRSDRSPDCLDSPDRRRPQAVYEDLLAAKEDVLAEVFKELPASERANVKQSIRLLAEAADRVLARSDKQIQRE